MIDDSVFEQTRNGQRSDGSNSPNLRYAPTKKKEWAGFSLLDGQQRVRALIAGLYGEEKTDLCLWVDLGARNAGQSPQLQITSRAQPFGYRKDNGNKLTAEDRRNARLAIEPQSHEIRHSDRVAYDFELFRGKVTQDGRNIDQPPRPFGAKGPTYKLHQLLQAWLEAGCPETSEKGIAALSRAFGSAEMANDDLLTALRSVDAAFRRVTRAQVALILVDPKRLGDTTSSLLTLFERIGAAGTPLSSEERLFSIYKHYAPQIRDVVDHIFTESGRVLTPTKIAATALRIANVGLARPSYAIPDVATFAKDMADKGEISKQLHLLLPINDDTAEFSHSPVGVAFKKICELLRFTADGGAFWLPDLMLVALPAELWQVLVYWATEQSTNNDPTKNYESSRPAVVRFAMYWHLFSWDNETAARRCFAYLKVNPRSGNFPDQALYQVIYADVRGKRSGVPVITPKQFAHCLQCSYIDGKLLCPASSALRSTQQRFAGADIQTKLAAQWWWSAKKALPWLQRHYVRRTFPGYMPLTDHEDDLPYDIDHVLPTADWDEWRRSEGAQNRLDVPQPSAKAMQDFRRDLGDGIGNKRLISSSDNRHDQDADIAKKAPELVSDRALRPEEQEKLRDMGFSPEERTLWRRVSSPEPDVAKRIWTSDRLSAWQQATEERTIRLYAEFYNSLNFSSWAEPVLRDTPTLLAEASNEEEADDH